MQLNNKPAVLLILDGWGYREATDANAIALANTPTWDRLWQDCPHTLISGSGADVGLPHGQMGNSEVGHLNLGAGRMVPQELCRIGLAIENGDFFRNPALCQAIDGSIATDNAVHIFGLLSPGGVHSHEYHIQMAAKMAIERGAKRVYVHAFLDGRDTPPQSAQASLEALQDCFKQWGCGSIGSICGRYYAMDRDQRWERVQLAYDMLTTGKAEFQANDAVSGLQMAYQRDETDEFVKPTRIDDAAVIADGDSIIFMNFRADRARELSRAFIEPDFTGFAREKRPQLSDFVTLTEYAKTIDSHIAFAPQQHNNVLGSYISDLGGKQLRIAETEKYAHVTFFFNGGIETPFAGEDRELIPSPKVATYDLQPEMNAPLLTDKLVAAIESEAYDLIICNYANPDMVGHSGKLDAAIIAVECIDHCVDRVTQALAKVGGDVLITADHGNVEQMFNTDTGQPHTAHTSEPVPLVYVGQQVVEFSKKTGTLADIAPTLLRLMGLEQPSEMTGESLLHVA